MSQEEDKYHIFLAMLVFFLLAGLFVFINLLSNKDFFDAFNGFFDAKIENQTEIKKVNFDQSIFAQPNFTELQSSEAYKFDESSLVKGKGELFEINLSDTVNK